jgi:phenylacetate-coenzyme A ligase PaaK-like adenylate-forming protein
MLEVHPFPVTLPLDDIVAGLNRAQPTLLAGYASMLGVLAAEAVAGRLRIAPTRLIAMSEPLLPEVRMAAEDAFGTPVANFYGTSEGGGVALGCWQSEGMHINEDLVILEPVDVAGRPVPPGVRADKVLLTNLFNPVQPLIRYELTDEIVVLDEPCPCGSAYRRVADIQGRHDDLFVYAGMTIHPHVLRSALAKHPAVVEYQVRQTTSGLDVDVIAPGEEPKAVDRVGRDLAAALRSAGLPEPDVTVQRVPALARHTATGKLRRFVPLVPTTATTIDA